MKRCYSTLLTVTKPKIPLNSKSQLLTLLDSCNSISQIKQAHAQLITTGLILRPIPATKLLKSLTSTNFASLPYAHHVFDQIPSPDIFIYNTMIKASAIAPTNAHLSSCNSLVIFQSMLRDPNVLPNQYTFVFVLKACSSCVELGVSAGEQVRVHAVKVGLESNVFVTNILIKMYADWALLGDARKVFRQCPTKDMYSWNTMISGYVGSGDINHALELFDEMPERNVVSWSIVIAGFVQVGRFLEAIELFHSMLQNGSSPNEFTLVSALTACANLLALDQGRWIHAYIERMKIKMNERLLASLIDMYAKCGEREFAAKVFYGADTALKQKIWPWNAMISGFAMHGRSKEAIEIFEQMSMANIVPNGITFVSLLNACSHGKLVDEGKWYFKSMVSLYNVEPEIEHYGCMVDLLGRAGLLNEAEEMILTMPLVPDTVIWGALLGACRIHGDTERGERVGKIIRELDPDHVGCHVLLANMYSATRRWNEAKVVRERAEIIGIKKTPGCSSIELNGMVHQFLVGDRSHPQTKHIYMFLDEMTIRLKNAGYVPETDEVLLDIDDEEDKETSLSRHSEKLAIAFGLMKTSPGTPIRIMKNLRVCGDCHQVTKYISTVYDREIIVRDRVRFHHFRDGECSCKDHW